jgi:hypothetical protein
MRPPTLDLAQAERPGELTQATEVTILEIIARAAADPSVEVSKMGALLDLQERVMAKQAEIEFTRDFAAASAEMPRIVKRGVIDMGSKGKIPFAKYEDLDRAIRPIEQKYGFTRSFRTEAAQQPGVLMVAKLAHRSGHSETSTRWMPPDPGPGRNAMQALGSADSYAKRYLTIGLWNLITEGADDDGVSTGCITQDQADDIRDLMTTCGMYDSTPDAQRSMAAFWEMLGLPADKRSPEHILVPQHRMVLAQLRQKARRK